MIDYKRVLICLARGYKRRHMTAADEGAIVGWATNESGEHYPIHEATGGGSPSGGKSSYREKMLASAKKHRERAEKAQAEAERRWNNHSEMARETPMGQPVIRQSYGNYRKSMQNEFEKSREAHNKAEYHQRKAENIEKRFAKVDVGKVRAEIAQREGYKTALTKASKAINAGNREGAIAAISETNPTLGKYLEKQTTGTLKQMINGAKQTNTSELKRLKKQEERAWKEG